VGPRRDIPKSQWHLPGFLWFPGADLYGIQRVEYLDDVLVLCGAFNGDTPITGRSDPQYDHSGAGSGFKVSSPSAEYVRSIWETIGTIVMAATCSTWPASWTRWRWTWCRWCSGQVRPGRRCG
jgi:hypothetical protein